jgi:hypothetical protein
MANAFSLLTPVINKAFKEAGSAEDFVLNLIRNNVDTDTIGAIVRYLPEDVWGSAGPQAIPSGYGLETAESLQTDVGKLLENFARRATYTTKRTDIDPVTGKAVRVEVEKPLQDLATYQREGILEAPYLTNAATSTGRISNTSRPDFEAINAGRSFANEQEGVYFDRSDLFAPNVADPLGDAIAGVDPLTGERISNLAIRYTDDAGNSQVRYVDPRAVEYGQSGAGKVFLEPEDSPIPRYEQGDIPEQMDFFLDKKTGLLVPGELQPVGSGFDLKYKRKIPRIAEQIEISAGTPVPGSSVRRISRVAQDQPLNYQERTISQMQEGGEQLIPDESYTFRSVSSPIETLDPEIAREIIADFASVGSKNISNMARLQSLIKYHRARQDAVEEIKAAFPGRSLPSNVVNAMADKVAKRSVIDSIKQQGQVRIQLSESLSNRAYRILMDNNIPLTQESMKRAANLVYRAFAEVSPKSTLKTNIEDFIEVNQRLIDDISFDPEEIANLTPTGKFVSQKPRQSNKAKALKTLRSIFEKNLDQAQTLSEGTKIAQLQKTFATGGAVGTPDTGDLRIAGLIDQRLDINRSPEEISMALKSATDQMVQAMFNDPYIYKQAIDAINQGYSDPVLVNAVSQYLGMDLAGRPGIVQGAVSRDFIPSNFINRTGQRQLRTASEETLAFEDFINSSALTPAEKQAVLQGLITPEELAQREALSLAGGNI